MNSSTIKLLIAGVLLLLFLSACVPYHQAYYPDGGAYSSYGGSQRYGYGGRHPYSNNHNNHHQPNHYDGYHSRPSWNNGYGNDYHNRYENHEQAHDQRERHHRDHYQ